MNKFRRGLLLIIMMYGHNYVLNQAQALQKEIQNIHDVTVTEFNLLYSIPSAVSILFIIPLGFMYERFSNSLLIAGAIALSLGELMVTLFGPTG
jgi:hypothetical protein